MTEVERLDQLLIKQEAKIVRAIRDYLAIINSNAVQAIVIDLLEAGRSEDAIQLLSTYVAQIGDTMPEIWREIGRDAIRELRKLIPEVAVGISFDVTFPRAAELIRQNRLEFITSFTKTQRDTARQAIERAATEGLGPRETARHFFRSIGLAPNQERAVANYRRLLEANRSDALSRAMRDPRFDALVQSAIEQGKPLTPRQINMMVERYRQNFIRMRAETIARTEAHEAFNAARDEAVEQMVEQSGIDPDRASRIWNVTRDGRERDWHATMHRQERKIGEKFVDGKGNQLMRPGDKNAPAETIIQCRCTLTFRIAPAA